MSPATPSTVDDLGRVAAAFELRGRRALVCGGGDRAAPVATALALTGAEVAVADSGVGTGLPGPGTLDILVCVADAPAAATPLAELASGDWQRALAGPATRAFLTTRACLPRLSRDASVVFLAPEDAGRRAQGVHQAAGRAAFAGLARSLAGELGPSGVRVNLVAPGPAATAAQTAAVVLFLAGAAAFISGQTFPVAGGAARSPQWSDRRALVTGGTRGVGRAISLALAAAGAGVLACYREDESAAALLAADPGWDPDRCHTLRADLTTATGRECAAVAARDRFGGLDILVNNLGTYRPAPLRGMPPAEVEQSLHTNLATHLLVTQRLLPLLGDGGAVVNVGAGMADRGRPDHTLFTAAKAGLVGFTRSLSLELADHGIRANTVAPGVVETERGLDLPAPVRAQILSAIPLRRFATPRDVADLVLFLAGELASGVTGAVVNVDGGI